MAGIVPPSTLKKIAKTELLTAAGIATSISLAEDRLPTALLGGISRAVRAAAANTEDLHNSLLAWRFAYWSRHLYPNSAASRQLAEKTCDRLIRQLDEARKVMDKPLAEAVARDIDYLRGVLAALRTGLAGVPVSNGAKIVPKIGHLARLENAALAGKVGDAELGTAFRRWREACSSYALTGVDASGNPLSIEKAGEQLAAAIDKALTNEVNKTKQFMKAGYYRDRIASASQGLRKGQPSEATMQTLMKLENALKQETKDQALAQLIQRHIFPAVTQSPHSWDKLANVIDGLQAVKKTDTDAVSYLISRVKGVLGEMLGVSAPAYRSAYQEAAQHADHLVAVLNHRAVRGGRNPSFRVVMPQFDLKAPGASGRGTRLFFDDAILVVDDDASQAFVVFAAQVKAGDASTVKAAQQMIDDQTRLLQGSIVINESTFKLVPPPDIASVSRVFVGTRVPPGMANVSGRINLVTGPVGGVELARFAEYLLTLAGKVK